MRSKILVVIVLVFLTILVLPESTNGEGNIDTSLSMTIPELTVGQEATISTTISSSFSPPSMGFTDYYGIKSSYHLGKQSGSSISSNAPKIGFELDQTITTSFLQIPVTVPNLLNSNNYYYNITQGSSLIAEGQTNSHSAAYMLDSGYFMIVLGTIQSSVQNVTFIAQTPYEISLWNSMDSEFIFDATTSSETTFYNGNIDTGNSVQLIVHETENLGEVDVTSGTHTFSFEPNTSYEQILAYYSTAGFYTASYDLQFVSFSNPTNYLITTSDASSTRGTNVILTATLQKNQEPVVGIKIDFKLNQSRYLGYIGSSITNDFGSAELTITLDQEIGEYEYIATAVIFNAVVTSTSKLSVLKPNGYLTGISSLGQYGSGAGSNTLITVNGYLETATAKGIENGTVNIYRLNSLLGTTSTDTTGYFSIEFEWNLDTGTYYDYWKLSASHQEYAIGNTTADVAISKTTPNVNLEKSDFNLKYNDELRIMGNVSDISDDLINTNLIIERFETSWIQITQDMTTGGKFNISLPTDFTGQYTYRVKTVSSTNYLTTSTSFNVVVGQVEATLQANSSYYSIRYHENTTIEVRIESLYNVEGDILVEIQDAYNLGNFDEMFTATTVNKTLQFVLSPPDDYINYPDYYYAIKFSLISDIYQSSSLSINFRLTWTDIEISNTTGETIVGVSTSFTFSVDDAAGIPIDDGYRFSLSIDNTILYTYSLAGMVTFDYTFNIIGEYQIEVSLVDDNENFPYRINSRTQTIIVEKADYVISSQDVIGNRGEYVTITGNIIDQLGMSVNNKNIEIQRDTGTWSTIASTLSDANGYFSIELFIDQTFSLGVEQLRIYADGTINFNQKAIIIELTIEKTLTTLTLYHQTSFEYNSLEDDRIVEIQLTNVFGASVSDASITISYNDNTVLLTTDNNGRASIILENKMLPDTYSIQALFAGDQTRLGSQNTSSFRVTGTSTYMEFTKPAVDTYRGEAMELEMRLYDAQNENLTGVMVRYYINDVLVATSITNSTGYATISLQIDYPFINLELKAEVIAYEGYEAVISIQNFKQINRNLHISFTYNNDNSTIIYLQNQTELKIQSYSNYEIHVAGATVRVYLYNYENNQYAFIGSYLTDANGLLNINIDLPVIDSWNFYQFKIELYKQYYNPIEHIEQIGIEKRNFDVITNGIDSTYLSKTQLTFQLIGPEISGKYIYAYYGSGTSLYEASGYTNIDGYLQLDYPATHTGSISITFRIVDPRGNFFNSTGTITIVINPAQVDLLLDQRDISGDPYYNISTSVNGIQVATEVRLNFDNIYTTNLTVEGSYLVDMSGWNILEVTIIGNDKFISMSQTVSIEREPLSLALHTSQLYAGVDNNISIEIITDQDLNGHQIDIYIIEGSTTTFLGRFFSINSWVNTTLDTILIEGDYQIRIEYPTQSFFESIELTQNIAAIKQDIDVTLSQPEFVTGLEIALQINTSFTLILPTTLEIVLYIDQNIIIQQTITAGTDTIYFEITHQIGSYQFKLEILESIATHQYILEKSIFVEQQTKLEAITSNNYQYSDENIIEIRLFDPTTNSGLYNQKIRVEICKTSCFVFSEFMGYYQTNSSGYIRVVLPTGLEPDWYYIKTSFDSQIAESQNESFPVYIAPEQPEIKITIVDYGITHNITITITILDENRMLDLPGELQFTNMNYTVEISGEYTLVIYGSDAIGQNSLSVTFEPDSPYYFPAMETASFGWERASQIIVEGETVIGYKSGIDLQFYINEVPITGISVEIYIDKSLYATTTLTNGRLDSTLTLPLGTYQFEVVIKNDLYFLNEVVYEREIVIVKGDVTFDFTINDTTYGNTVIVTISDTVDDADYHIKLVHENGKIYNFNSNSSRFVVPVLLEVGKYNITITRYHQYINNYSHLGNLKIYAIDATISPNQFNEQLLEIKLNPIILYSDFSIWINLQNDTHSIPFEITGRASDTFYLNITGLESGSYSLNYIISGIYKGEGKIIIELVMPRIQNNSGSANPQTNNPKISDTAVATLFILGLSVVGIIRKKSL